MLTFLAVNGIALTYTQKELYTLILNVASGSSNYEDICKFISAHENERI